jgi:hypothetical protein
MESTNVNGDEKSGAADSKIFSFRCAFKTEMPEDDEGDLYVAEYLGELFVTLEDGPDDEEHPAGETRLFIINADAAELRGESLWELLDEGGNSGLHSSNWEGSR